MIITLIITIIMQFVGIFTSMINTGIDEQQLATQYMEKIGELIEFCTQGVNFVHFMVGDTIYIILPLVTALLVFKYVLYPIVDIIRRLIPFVNL